MFGSDDGKSKYEQLVSVALKRHIHTTNLQLPRPHYSQTAEILSTGTLFCFELKFADLRQKKNVIMGGGGEEKEKKR